MAWDRRKRLSDEAGEIPDWLSQLAEPEVGADERPVAKETLLPTKLQQQNRSFAFNLSPRKPMFASRYNYEAGEWCKDQDASCEEIDVGSKKDPAVAQNKQ